MIYNGIDLSEYPICDTDIWIDAILAKLDAALIEKYHKIIVADVVEKEIMYFEKSDYFKIIAERYSHYKQSGTIITINHSDINAEDRKLLEKQLIDCDSRFKTGLKDRPHEKHKGEIVSAIYAEHFELPFLKSNDGAFREGNMGQIAFPALIVKNLNDMLNDLVPDLEKRNEHYYLLQDNRALLAEEKRIYEEMQQAPVTIEQVQALLNKWRGSYK